MSNPNTHLIIKSKQLCFLFPWNGPREGCPYPHGYTRVGILQPTGRISIQIVRQDGIQKQLNNKSLPNGIWVNLTK